MDGDTDTAPVQQDFENVVKEHIQYIKTSGGEPATAEVGNGSTHHGPVTDVRLQDFDMETIDTVSKRVVGNGVSQSVANGVNHMANGVSHLVNGFGAVRAPAMGNGAAPQYTSLDRGRVDARNPYSEVNFMDGNI